MFSCQNYCFKLLTIFVFLITGISTHHIEKGRDSNPEPKTCSQSQETTSRNDAWFSSPPRVPPLLSGIPTSYGQQWQLPGCQFHVPVLWQQLCAHGSDGFSVPFKHGLPPPPPSRVHANCRLSIFLRISSLTHGKHAKFISSRSNGINYQKILFIRGTMPKEWKLYHKSPE